MIATISKNQLILVDTMKSCDDIKDFFKMGRKVEDRYVWCAAVQDVIVKAEQSIKDSIVIKSIFNNFKDMMASVQRKVRKKLKKGGKNKHKKDKTDDDKNKENVIVVGKPELRVLWVSRHNMSTEGYIDLTKMYPDYNVCVYPCQPRIIEARQIIELAKQYNCKVICAILSDDMFKDLVSRPETIMRDYSIYKPILEVEDTGRNYSPKRSLAIRVQKEYNFIHWLDMRTGYPVEFAK